MLSQSAVDGVVVWWVVAGRWRKLRPMLSSDGVAASAARPRIVEAGGWWRSKRTQRSKGASTDDAQSRERWWTERGRRGRSAARAGSTRPEGGYPVERRRAAAGFRGYGDEFSRGSGSGDRVHIGGTGEADGTKMKIWKVGGYEAHINP